jgi:hypothetical protein
VRPALSVNKDLSPTLKSIEPLGPLDFDQCAFLKMQVNPNRLHRCPGPNAGGSLLGIRILYFELRHRSSHWTWVGKI